MPADPSFDEVKPGAIRMPGDYYGCHNKPRPVEGQPVVFKHVSWPYRFSTECRYDRSTEDSRCKGCQWAGQVQTWHKGESK